MAKWNKFLWGGLGWALGGPIGGILGFAIGTMADFEIDKKNFKPGTDLRTHPGDFAATMLILFAAVMKSDDKILKSELDFVKKFFVAQFGEQYAQERLLLLREILKQDYSLEEVCLQVKHNLDKPSKLQLINLLFALAGADGEFHKSEIATIEKITSLLGVDDRD